MDIKLLEKLKQLGLPDNEAMIYLAVLELGQGTVTEISKAATLNRTTGYDILERLCIQGIISRSKTGKKRIYVAETPARLSQFLENKKRQTERRLKELENFLPDLQALHKTELKPVIKFAEGKKEMEQMYYHKLNAKKTIYSILNLKKYAEFFDEMGTYQSQERFKKGIKEKILAVENDTAKWWYNKTYKGNKKKQKNTEYLWIKDDAKYKTAGEISIFDDKVIGILSKPSENVAFEIQSQTFADFLKMTFEMAWKQAEK